MMLAAAQPYAVEQLTCARRRSRASAELDRYLNVLLRRECWNQLKSLEDEPHLLAPDSRPLILA
jgi:hypothetical protein